MLSISPNYLSATKICTSSRSPNTNRAILSSQLSSCTKPTASRDSQGATDRPHPSSLATKGSPTAHELILHGFLH
ncbi:hypothetical protein BCR34DRAFT_579669 [Clohesyomyces aquaticus]|uniref:Uncharacterized protein n=1 Tax=Clohesyomyces aquaticus TaxID=1231657 RepID=A0A1Y1YA97_9PLEO|nr:hypothetical protein BCR34DRAFT_579669 [Clohesyomyces aquaticus]